MKQKLPLFLGCFIAYYFFIHVAVDLPYLVNGRFHLLQWPSSVQSLSEVLLRALMGFLMAWLPYRILLKQHPRRTLLAVLLILVAVPLLFLLQYWLECGLRNTAVRLRYYFNNHVLYVLLCSVFGIVCFFVRYTAYKEWQQQALALQHRQAELSFLRSQINPHFLFNSLNNIYSLVYQGSEKALTAIAGFSDLLRYMLYDAEERVPLEKELSYIRQYIQLQQLRFEQPVDVRLQVSGNIAAVLVPPLLLIPFVENAFKHGDLSAAEGLTITVQVEAQRMLFYCHNKTGRHEKDSHGGIGLDNVQRRLQLLYHGRHRLTMNEQNGSFTINLELIYA
ncbi:MAG: histidine kinase [Candidatus Pseudobacter hemicellulosilyticus]|uniref:Histidine kinase n=1 Tax=Candidatus Pseudobacter hemicellulosilyticus TaxID=3121375 RepID=A0AAJ6BHM6_9BACT|nr:MAG: histidine kinase [Pseudobacter sp.]